MTGNTAAPVVPTLADRVRAWEDDHPGWRIAAAGRWFEVLDPAGCCQIREPDPVVLVNALDQASLRAGTEQEHLALLRSAHPGECVVVDHGEWESTRHGIGRITAPAAWLLEYRLLKAGR